MTQCAITTEALNAKLAGEYTGPEPAKKEPVG